jgi:hypothetical protein
MGEHFGLPKRIESILRAITQAKLRIGRCAGGSSGHLRSDGHNATVSIRFHTNHLSAMT